MTNVFYLSMTTNRSACNARLKKNNEPTMNPCHARPSEAAWRIRKYNTAIQEGTVFTISIHLRANKAFPTTDEACAEPSNLLDGMRTDGYPNNSDQLVPCGISGFRPWNGTGPIVHTMSATHPLRSTDAERTGKAG